MPIYEQFIAKLEVFITNYQQEGKADAEFIYLYPKLVQLLQKMKAHPDNEQYYEEVISLLKSNVHLAAKDNMILKQLSQTFLSSLGLLVNYGPFFTAIHHKMEELQQARELSCLLKIESTPD